jgi:hypothetical protein
MSEKPSTGYKNQMTTSHAPLTLTLARSHNSILTLPLDTTLPAFSFVTGLNGAGKSHLLEGIQNGAIMASIAGTKLSVSADIKHATWASLAPSDSAPFGDSMIDQERFDLARQIDQHIESHRQHLRNLASNLGVAGHAANDLRLLMSITPEQLADHVVGTHPASNVHQTLHQQSSAISSGIRQPWLQNSVALRICDEAERKSGLPLAALGFKDFISSTQPNWGASDIFQHQFGRAFVQYRGLERANRSRQFDQVNKRPVDDVLSDADFIKTHGIAPWTFVNEAMVDAGLDFEINVPDRHATGLFTPQLTKRSTGAEISFGGLSSGEKVLMALALSLYYAADKRTLAAYPRLLLLDEADAPLHPSMSAYLVRIIEKTLVGRHGIYVIATTHSPSTIALAPEGSVFIMDAKRPGVHPTTKAQALNILTAGVPTLAISFDGRRQVFAEAETDAYIYSALWQLLKRYITIDRSLEFIAPGIKDRKSGSDIHHGCAIVEHLVSTIAEAGVTSTFGIIDWDGKNTSSSRVIVIAEGLRYSLENIILDPRLVAALLLHTPGLEKDQRSQLGITDLTYSSYCEQNTPQLQLIVTAVAQACFGALAEAVVDVTYADGVKLKISSHYLKHSGHDLAETVLPSTFPMLRRHQGPNRLMRYMVDTIVSDKPGLLPSDVLTAFETIINTPAH